MTVSVDEAKNYLRVDQDEDDALIESLIHGAEDMCFGVLRETPEDAPELLKVAVLYAVAFLYEHREEADHKELSANLRSLLSSERKAVF